MRDEAHTLRRLLQSLGAVLAVMLLATGCASSGVNTGDFNLISIEEEWQLGQQLERDLGRQLSINNDSVINGYVDRLGRRLVAQTEMANLPWKFHVVNSPEVNAFNIPGGHVYVNTGLIANTDSVAELAGVMAHEIAHGVERHGTEQLTRVYGLNILAGVLLGNDPATYERILAQIIGTGTVARFSRGAEREADGLGVRTMYEAGYDPRGMVAMFQSLLEQRRRSPNTVDQFFASHPLTEERIRATQEHIAQLPAKSGLVMRDPAYQGVRQRAAR
ncbi:MAG TPA: M48 family metallopeptidase [Thermoanaerobaculia bacterium]